MENVQINEIGLINEDELEFKIHFQINDNKYFAILGLKSGAFVSNAATLNEEENQALAHYFGHQVEKFMASRGTPIPPESKCHCH